MSTHNLCFEQKFENKNIRIFTRKFSFLVVKFSVYLNRLVFAVEQFEYKIYTSINPMSRNPGTIFFAQISFLK